MSWGVGLPLARFHYLFTDYFQTQTKRLSDFWLETVYQNNRKKQKKINNGLYIKLYGNIGQLSKLRAYKNLLSIDITLIVD